MRHIIFISLCILLSGCTTHAFFTPERNNLNDATVGTPYYDEINIFGGPVFSINELGEQVIVGDVQPDNTGLNVQYCNDDKLNNCIQIRGTPTKAGTVKIRVSGGLGGNMFASPSEFDKTYTINVKAAE